MKYSIIGGIGDTRNNKEDFAITPFLFGIITNVEYMEAYGIGICWGFYCCYIGIGKNIPKNKRFQNLIKK